MKKIIFFAFLVFVTNSVFSQILVKASDCETVYNNGDTIYINADQEFNFSVYNAHTTDLTYKAIVTHIYIPADAIGVEVCTAGTCATPTGPQDIGFGITIGADSCDAGHLNYWSNSSIQDFFMRLKFVNTNDDTDTATICFMYDYSLAGVPSVVTENNITIAPNPASNQVFITYDVLNSEYVELYDIKGSLLQQFSINSAKGNFYMNTSYLPNGIYIVKIGNESKKFAIRH
ncbi:MAG: T9SS type A sorting domain-containing protein [Bacteroidales bacterium]|nr:T9SS type A sorting domain-containing protein [Bacteroidales bacterium]